MPGRGWDRDRGGEGRSPGAGAGPGSGGAAGRGWGWGGAWVGRGANGLPSLRGRRESGRKRRGKGGTRKLPRRSPRLGAPTPCCCSASCPLPGHAPPQFPSTQSPRRPPEPPQSRPRRMGALRPSPRLPPPLLLLMLGKPTPSRPPTPPAGAGLPAPSPARPPRPRRFGAPSTCYSVRGAPSLPELSAQLP